MTWVSHQLSTGVRRAIASMLRIGAVTGITTVGAVPQAH
jgi:hypothetical protein